MDRDMQNEMAKYKAMFEAEKLKAQVAAQMANANLSNQLNQSAQASAWSGSKQYKTMNQEAPQQENTIASKEVTIDEAKNIILPILKTAIVPFLWGPPGVGKSTLVRDICRDNDWDLIDLRLSLLNPVDLRGLPVVNRGERLAEWYHPSFLPNGHHVKPGVLFLDEINLAPLSVQAAAYQLILDKQVGEYKFPKHWKIIAAGNREVDRANVYKLSAPLANRFIHLTINPTFGAWLEWAKDNGKIREEIIDFLIIHPSHLLQMPRDSEKAFASPRTWAFLSELLDTFEFEGDLGVNGGLAQVILGTVGEATGQLFIVHLNNYKLKDIARDIENFIKTGKITIPNEPESLRFSIITAILDAHLSGRVDIKKYQTFLQQVSEEEKATIEEQRKHKLAESLSSSVNDQLDGGI